ncbi:MAG: hypothetical protein AAGG53_04390 [Cyanobacteria bacterium P01_H01_bin.152]
MVDISFNPAGQFQGTDSNPTLITNPTTLQFGPDGRLYVTEQDGTINVFTITKQGDTYTATAVEEIDLIKKIRNHDDDGSRNNLSDRQVTGLAITGTASEPILYVSSSDPRIAFNRDSNLDTNSGVITRLTLKDGEWEAVDIIRGLPRSEQSHATNGLALSPNGTKLYIAQGGNTNNGAPSRLFAYASESALSGTVLEVNLNALNRLPILTDPNGGQNNTSRQYIYDLHTLDDPTVDNDGIRENSSGLDVEGPWGGNDGFNMPILPANAPIKIFADGFRNHFDLVFTQTGNLYTVDNGSNSDNGGDPITDSDGEATNQPNDGGVGSAEPLFLIERGGYYGHPNPTRANQDLAWTVYDNNGNLDSSLAVNTVPDLSALVPFGIPLTNGFLIAPGKFTRNAERLRQSGERIPYDSPLSPALTTLGSSSNGLVEYTSDAFDGALKGALLVAQFNGNVTLLNLNDAGTALEPLIGPGDDGILGSADDITVDEDGVYTLLTGFSTALDVTVGPEGSIWVAEIGGDLIKAFSPSEILSEVSTDFDNDGLDNKRDPFIRDASNGTALSLLPGQTLLWDFDANQDGNLPGPNGYGGGLTGVMVNGRTDFEEFFRTPSDLPGQNVKLDNVKFLTAAAGGTTVIENVSNGSPLENNNNAEYLFHTGVSIDDSVDNFTIKWITFNPGSDLSEPSQQIGGYIGTGDQRHYLKLVATPSADGEIQFLLENGNRVQSNGRLQADDLFQVSGDQNRKIVFELDIDVDGAIATPTVTYETQTGNKTVEGGPIDIRRTGVYRAIKGRTKVRGQQTGLAVGLFSSNLGQPEDNTFQAIFDDIEITAGSAAPDQRATRANAQDPLLFGGQQLSRQSQVNTVAVEEQITNSVTPSVTNTTVLETLSLGMTSPIASNFTELDNPSTIQPLVPAKSSSFFDPSFPAKPSPLFG